VRHVKVHERAEVWDVGLQISGEAMAMRICLTILSSAAGDMAEASGGAIGWVGVCWVVGG
jgi:hypothetical protein